MNSTHKKTFIFALVAVLLIVPFFVTHADPPFPGPTQINNPLSVGDIPSLITIIVDAVKNIGYFVIVLFIIYSGFLFVTARGDTGQIDDAKHIFKYVVIGSAILLGSVAIAAAINGTLCQLAPSLPQCFVGPRLP